MYQKFGIFKTVTLDVTLVFIKSSMKSSVWPPALICFSLLPRDHLEIQLETAKFCAEEHKMLLETPGSNLTAGVEHAVSSTADFVSIQI